MARALAECPVSPPGLLRRLTAGTTLDAAYAWLCKQRAEHGPNSSVWDLRLHWPTLKPKLQEQLRAGTFELGPTRTFVDAAGERREMRDALDALVLRALAQTLTPVLEPAIPSACTHIAGHGGAKGAIRQVLAALPDCPFVCKTDVQRYYASINQVILMAQLGEQITEPVILRWVWQAIRRTTWEDGRFTIESRPAALRWAVRSRRCWAGCIWPTRIGR